MFLEFRRTHVMVASWSTEADYLLWGLQQALGRGNVRELCFQDDGNTLSQFFGKKGITSE